MSLQVRLTHSLGERLIELDARSADHPAVVGRAPDAQVPVPSASVGKQHCLLFVYEGRWVVQGGQSQAGTFLNGEPVTDPCFLNTGDMIALGPAANSPTLLIDPHGLGTAEEFTQAPAAARTAAALPPPAHVPQPGGYAPAYAPPPQPYPASAARSGFVDSDEGTEGDVNIFAAAPMPPPTSHNYSLPAYGAPASVPGYPAPGGYGPPQPSASAWGAAPTDAHESRKPIRRKKPQGTNPAIVVAVGVIGLIAVIILVVIVVQKQKDSKIANTAPAKPAPVAAPKSTSMFDSPGGSGTPVGGAPAPKPKPAEKAPPVVVPRPSPGASAAPDPEVVSPEMETKKSDPKYMPIDEARLMIESGKPQLAVARLLELETEDNPFKKEISEFKDQAFDRLWWIRISELLEEKAKNQKEIADRKQLIKDSADADYKAARQKEITRYESLNASIDENLKAMQYASPTSPRDLPDSELAGLKSQRDAARFDKWRKEVEPLIKSSRGAKLRWPTLN